MLARIAHELFWLGRDLTRGEHTARTLDGAFHADVAGAPGERSISLSWDAVLTIIGGKPLAPGEDTVEVDRDRDRDRELEPSSSRSGAPRSRACSRSTPRARPRSSPAWLGPGSADGSCGT